MVPRNPAKIRSNRPTIGFPTTVFNRMLAALEAATNIVLRAKGDLIIYFIALIICRLGKSEV
jgi:hypothetical protein